MGGHVRAGFGPVEDVFRASLAAGDDHGAAFCAIVDGEVVVNLWGGWASRDMSRSWEASTLVPVYSTTKGIAALVVAMAVERLPAGYETPVAEVWPEFAARGKGAVTIGEAMSHCAGLPGFADPIDPALWLDPPACAAAIAALAPMWPPGRAHGYHPLTWGYIAGEIVRRITGKSLGTVLRAEVCIPSGIDFWIGLPATEHARCADILRPKALPDLGPPTPARRAAFLSRWSAPDRGGAIWREVEIPSANGHGTAAAVAALYHIYASSGAGLVGADTFAALTRARADGEDLVLPMATRFGAGIMLNSHGYFGPNPSALGHCGWGGSMAIADPAARLSAAYVMNRQSNILVGDQRAVRLVRAVYDGLD